MLVVLVPDSHMGRRVSSTELPIIIRLVLTPTLTGLSNKYV